MTRRLAIATCWIWVAIGAFVVSGCTSSARGDDWRARTPDGRTGDAVDNADLNGDVAASRCDGRGGPDCGLRDAVGDAGFVYDTSFLCGRHGEVVESYEDLQLKDQCTVFVGSFRFENEPMEDLGKLFPLRVINGSLIVRSNRSLGSFDGMFALWKIWGDLIVEDNPNFAGPGYLTQLHRIEGTLRIAGNPSLEALSGMPRLKSVGELVVEDNEILAAINETTLSESLEEVRGDVVFAGNPKLSEADVRKFLEGVEVEGEVRIDE